MQISYTALMKKLKELQNTILRVRQDEASSCTVTYSNKEDLIESNYDYDLVRKQLDELYKKEFKIKSLLDKANVNTLVKGYDFSLNEALVILAQLSSKKAELELLASKKPLVRKNVGYGGGIDYTKTLYDVEVANKDLAKIKEEIANLQMAIDLTNLTSFVEYDG